MQPRIREVLTYLDAQYEALRGAFDAVPIEKRATSPGDAGWSPAGVIEHLAIVETSIGRLLTQRVAAGRESGVGAESEDSSVLETFAVAQAVVNRGRKIVSNERLHPTGLSPDDAWKAFDAAHANLRSAVVSADGLALGEIVHPHPVWGPLNLYHWVAFVGGHEARHAEQIREAAATAS